MDFKMFEIVNNQNSQIFFLNSSMKDLIKTTINPGYTGYDSIIS